MGDGDGGNGDSTIDSEDSGHTNCYEEGEGEINKR